MWRSEGLEVPLPPKIEALAIPGNLRRSVVIPLSVAFLFGIGALAPARAISLRDAATAAGLFVGAAGNSSESERPPAPFVYDFSRSDRVVAFAEENGMRIRGHTFVGSGRFAERRRRERVDSPQRIGGDTAGAPTLLPPSAGSPPT